MAYDKLHKYILFIRMLQEADLDILNITSSRKGFGKSSFCIQAAREYMNTFGLYCNQCRYEWIYTKKTVTIKNDDLVLMKDIVEPCPKCGVFCQQKPKKFNFSTYLAYDNDEIRDLVHELPEFSPILADEGVRFMMGEDWNTFESKQMKKLFAQMRTKQRKNMETKQKESYLCTSFKKNGRYRKISGQDHTGYQGILDRLARKGYVLTEWTQEHVKVWEPFGDWRWMETFVDPVSQKDLHVFEKKGKFFIVHSWTGYNLHAPSGILYELVLSEVEKE